MHASSAKAALALDYLPEVGLCLGSVQPDSQFPRIRFDLSCNQHHHVIDAIQLGEVTHRLDPRAGLQDLVLS